MDKEQILKGILFLLLISGSAYGQDTVTEKERERKRTMAFSIVGSLNEMDGIVYLKNATYTVRASDDRQSSDIVEIKGDTMAVLQYIWDEKVEFEREHYFSQEAKYKALREAEEWKKKYNLLKAKQD